MPGGQAQALEAEIEGAVLLGGLAFGKPLLGMVFDSVFNLTNEAGAS